MTYIPIRVPNLAKRALELEMLRLPGTTYTFDSGRQLIYRLEIAASPASRLYQCELHVHPGTAYPEMIVISPDIQELVGKRKLPHIYPYKKRGTKLCLWTPMYGEWDYSMKLIETYVPWTVEWLWYFEHWLITDEWLGGGEQPTSGSRLGRPRNAKHNAPKKDRSING
jgi:hypothetical protein